MAIIRKFDQLELKANAHHTERRGDWSVQRQDGEKSVQINTVGSADREFTDKVSQTLRLSKEAIEPLAELARKHL